MPKLIFLLLILLHSITFSQISVKVEGSNGNYLSVNGNPIAPRMFWGAERGGIVTINNEWSEYKFEVKVPFEANATWHFRFGRVEGEIWITDLRIYDEDSLFVFAQENYYDQFGFNKYWNIYPPDERNTIGEVNVSDSTIHVSISNPTATESWPDFHLYSDAIKLEANKKYYYSYKIKSDSERNITPAVYHVNNGWTRIGGSESIFLKQVKMAKEAGVNFITLNTSNCWLPPELNDNWEPIELACQKLIDINPNVLLIPRVSMNAPTWWKERNPAALMVYDDGRVGTQVSISDLKYRKEAAEHLEKLCKHLVEKFPNNLAGIHPSGQNTGEWFYQDSWGANFSGYDSSTIDAWKKYYPKSDAVPTREERRLYNERLLMDPEQDEDIITFNNFLQDEMGDHINVLAAAARRGLGPDRLVVFFYGYHYEFGTMVNGPAVSGHYALQKILEQPYIDIIAGPISYYDRKLLGSGPVMSSVESIKESGKMWFNEDDTRTYLNTNLDDHNRHGGLKDFEETKSVLLRNLSQSFIRGYGSWWMDHGAFTTGGWFDDQRLWDMLDDFQSIELCEFETQNNFKPEMEIILDEKSMLYLSAGTNVIGKNLIYESRAEIARSGISYGQYMLHDILRERQAAKVQVLLNPWYITNTEKNLLTHYRKENTTRVWFYAPGYISKEKCDVEAMNSVSGFKHKFSKANSAMVYPTQLGKSYGLNKSWGITQELNPLFTVEEDSCEVLARFNNNEPAVVMKKNKQGYDIFVGTPKLTSEFLRAIAKISDCTPISDKDIISYHNDNYLAIHAGESETLALNFSESKKILEGFSNNLVGIGKSVETSFSLGETKLFKLSGNETSIDDQNNLFKEFKLYQNYPNPFNPSTSIKYKIPEDSYVEIKVFNLLGQEVETIYNKFQKFGNYEMIYDASNLSSGLYFYELTAGDFRSVKKMILLK